MTDIRKPRRGSLAFRPRKRAERLVPRVSFWPSVREKAVLGFAGYKAGMTSVSYIEQREGPFKGMEVTTGATVIETPPMVVYGIRAYLPNGEGKRAVDELVEDKEILKALNFKKEKAPKGIPEGAELVDVRLLAYAQPAKTGIGKKHIERMELGLGGSSVEEKLSFARELLGKELHVWDFIKEGQYIDVIAVTKGKGWQGPVKRFGVAKQRRKATGKVRHVGTLGPFHPAYVMYTVPQAGQMGFHKRTELNKWVMKVGKAEEVESINPKGGFPHYGLVKNDFIVVKGSVPGPVKRTIRLRWAIRSPGPVEPKITFISREPKN